MNRKLGLLPKQYDERDYIMSVKASAIDNNSPGVPWPLNKQLNQGNSNHCGGFALAHFLNCAPVMDQISANDAHNFYYACKEIDGNPTGEEGTYLRSICKVLKNGGYVNNYVWIPTLDIAEWWVRNFGPLLVGTMWTTGMFSTDMYGFAHPTGNFEGGHAYIWNWAEEGVYYFPNSWGDSYGDQGTFKMYREDFQGIFLMSGEVIAMVEKTTPIVNW